jgi:hypothetical protein
MEAIPPVSSSLLKLLASAGDYFHNPALLTCASMHTYCRCLHIGSLTEKSMNSTRILNLRSPTYTAAARVSPEILKPRRVLGVVQQTLVFRKKFPNATLKSPY